LLLRKRKKSTNFKLEYVPEPIRDVRSALLFLTLSREYRGIEIEAGREAGGAARRPVAFGQWCHLSWVGSAVKN